MASRHDIAELRGKIAGRILVLGFSGGKDSLAASLYLSELGLEHRRVFADTGWEHPDTLDYIASLEQHVGKIDVVKSEVGGMEEWIRKKKAFPARVFRWCTQELKVRPIRAYIQALNANVVNVTGIRAEESSKRAQLAEWEQAPDLGNAWQWRPIIGWTFEDVAEIHRRHNILPNPLYLRGASRVGCWPCIFARKKEIRQVADEDPGRITKIRELETEIGALSNARKTPTFFGRKMAQDDGSTALIDDVVAWSRTKHGGKEVELFTPDLGDIGCMRWGFCEHSANEGEDNE